MILLFGISNFTVDTYPQGTAIEKIANESEFVLKRTVNVEDSMGNITLHFSFLNKNLEPHKFVRNGWSLSNFKSDSKFHPSTLYIRIKDPDEKFFHDFTYTITDPSRFIYIRDAGVTGINSLLELFLEVSKYDTWLEFLKTRPEVVLDEKYSRNQAGEMQKDNENNEIEIQSIKEELELLKLENLALKTKLEQGTLINEKADRKDLLQRIIEIFWDKK